MAAGRAVRRLYAGAGALLVALLILFGSGPGAAVVATGPSPTPSSPASSSPAGSGSATASKVVPDSNPVPAGGRRAAPDPVMARTAVLIGDSQAAGAAGVTTADTWVSRGLASRGYLVDFVGARGTGYTAGSRRAANYPDALENGQMLLPEGTPALVVIQGGGNDASAGATDAQILANAGRLLRDLQARYPDSKFLIIGTVARGGKEGARRAEVDTLLGGFAMRHSVDFISTGNWLSKYQITNKMADGVHLTASGHKVLGKVLGSRLKALQLAPAVAPAQP